MNELAINCFRESGLHICKMQDVLRDTVRLTLTAHNFSRSPAIREASEQFAKGEQRSDVKQFLVKFRKYANEPANDVLSQQLPKLLPYVREAFGDDMQPYGSDIWYVMPSGDRPREWSQNWHRDPESDCVVKVMAYFWAVTEESGPLEYVMGSHKGKYAEVAKAKSYAPQNVEIPAADVTRLIVPAGTLAFVNTSGLHRGGYCKSEPRLSACWTFVRGK